MHQGAFGSLMTGLDKQNSRAFRLPGPVRDRFEGVKTGADGEFEDGNAVAPPKKYAVELPFPPLPSPPLFPDPSRRARLARELTKGNLGRKTRPKRAPTTTGSAITTTQPYCATTAVSKPSRTGPSLPVPPAVNTGTWTASTRPWPDRRSSAPGSVRLMSTTSSPRFPARPTSGAISRMPRRSARPSLAAWSTMASSTSTWTAMPARTNRAGTSLCRLVARTSCPPRASRATS